jgi:Flp pilus assembly protein TadD
VTAQEYNAVGLDLARKGHFLEAVERFRQAVTADPQNLEARYNFAKALRDCGRFDESIAAYRQLLEINPDIAAAWNNLGNLLKLHGPLDAAVEAYRHVLRLDPNDPAAQCNLGAALQELGKFSEALQAYARALALEPQFADAARNMGAALYEMGRVEESIEHFRTALRLRPDFVEAWHGLGTALIDLGEFDEAMAAFDQALSIRPGDPNCTYSRGLILLKQGKLAEGWKAYESRRWVGRVRCVRDFPQPCWNGADLHGRRILVHAEQGLGDTIQFARYIPMVKQRGGYVIAHCLPPLRRLLERQLGIDEISDGPTLPAFDVHCPMLSLPLVFATTLTSIPGQVPYLLADDQQTKSWRDRLAGSGGACKVGLAWAGAPGHKNDRNRSLRLAQFAPLLGIPDVQFVSLQKGDPASQAKQFAGPKLIDWTGELSDFADAAALLANLDLLVCVDTAVAHLAGAMGKPVWVLLPFPPDWRWMLGREDSPWYSTMRLFRQEVRGDWSGALKRLERELRSFAAAYDTAG